VTTIRSLGHACVRLDRDDQVLVVDPGTFSGPDALAGATGVLVTHEHPDHVDPPRLVAALDASPGLEVWAPPGVVDQLVAADADLARLHVVVEGDRFEAAGFPVEALGEWHAVIHPDIPRIPNLAYLVDGVVLHPGDSFTPPPPGTRVEVLCVPVSAPWLRIAEAVDYVRLVRPTLAVAIHHGILNDAGLALVDRVMGQLVPPTGYRRLAPDETLTLDDD